MQPLAIDDRPVPPEMLADAIATLTVLRDTAQAKHREWAERAELKMRRQYLALREAERASDYRCQATHLEIAIQAVTAALAAAQAPAEMRRAA